MTVVRRSPHHCWVLLAINMVAIPAAANASASDIMGGADQNDIPSRARAEQLPSSALSERCSPFCSHKRPVACPRFYRAIDPSEDGTSRDPSDDELWDDFAADDGDDQPTAAGLHDRGHGSITLKAEVVPPRAQAPAAPSPSRHHLRC
jgi:hypothetical protein